MSNIGNREFLKGLALAAVALTLSGATIIAGYRFLAPVLHPELKPYIDDAKAAPISISGNQFQPVIFAEGGVEGTRVVIRSLAPGHPEDHAVLRLQRSFAARDFAFLRYHIDGRHPNLTTMLFWQRADTPGTNYVATLNGDSAGQRYHNLLRSADWRGTITEVAIGFFGDLRDYPVVLHGIRLEPFSHSGLLRTVLDEWTAFSVWDQSSINKYAGAPENSLLYPVPVAAAWLAMAIVFLFALRKMRRDSAQAQMRLTAAIVALMVWCVLDGLWLLRLYQQNIETHYLFAGKTLHEKKLADWDGEYYAFGQGVKMLLPTGTNISVLYTERELLPLAQRLRLHLLPEHRTNDIRLFSRENLSVSLRENRYLIVLGPPAETNLAHRLISRPAAGTQLGKLDLIHSNTVGNLYLADEDHREGKP